MSNASSSDEQMDMQSKTKRDLIKISEKPLPAPAEKLDAWLQKVGRAAVELAGLPNSARLSVRPMPPLGTSIPHAHRECSIEAPGVYSRLLVAPTAKGLEVWVAGERRKDGEQISLWQNAIRMASGEPVEGHRTFSWVALLGPAAAPTPIDIKLLSQFQAGNMTVSPAGDPLYETIPYPTVLGGNGFKARSWPILVEGRSGGFQWGRFSGGIANVRALTDVHRLCCLLSLDTDVCFVVRDGPRPAEKGLSVPEELSSPADTTLSVPLDTQEFEHPEWLPAAWEIVREDESLTNILAAHHQGMSLHFIHPSYALIAFTAVVEAVAERLLGPPQRCPECNQMRGSTQRFRTTLDYVVQDAAEAARLADAYAQRSSTAHIGKLHGLESTFGATGAIGELGKSAGFKFAFSTLSSMRRASGHLASAALFLAIEKAAEASK